MFTTLFILTALGGGYGIYKWRQKENAKQAALDEEFKKLEAEITSYPKSDTYAKKAVDPSPWKRTPVPPPAPYVPPKPVEKKREESRSSDSGVGDFVAGAVVGAVVSSWLNSDSSSDSSSSSSSYSDSGWSSGGDSGGGGSSSDF